jgi:hypothetical protein
MNQESCYSHAFRTAPCDATHLVSKASRRLDGEFQEFRRIQIAYHPFDVRVRDRPLNCPSAHILNAEPSDAGPTS